MSRVDSINLTFIYSRPSANDALAIFYARPSLISTLQGLPDALSSHLMPFSSIFVSSARDITASFYGYLRGLFQSEHANKPRMNEVNEVGHQSRQHISTEGTFN